MLRYLVPPVFLIAIICVWLKSSLVFPPTFEIKDFPFLKQPDDISCGPTSVAMVLNCYGKPTSVDVIRKVTRTDWFRYHGEELGMTIPGCVVLGLQKLGFYAKKRIGTLDDIKFCVSNNQPPIVLLRSGEKMWHYVVVIGYYDNKIIIADPGEGEQIVMSDKTFSSAWDFTTDMDGEKQSEMIPAILHLGEVNGNTYIVVE
jgi:ABC-type bacteriocin/lantibiotic exporter with double-glycine peptidase domain